jgi:hypothetical protein
MRTAGSMLTVCLLAASCTVVLADGRTGKAPVSVVIRHGSDMTSALAGPAAAGLRQRQVAAGTVLRDGAAYDFARLVTTRARYDGSTVEGPHLLIEQVRFTGNIDIHTRLPVVMRGVAIRLEASAHWGLHTRPGAGRLYFLWSEITGPTGDPRAAAVGVAMMLRADGAVVYRSHLRGTVDGIQPSGSGIDVIECLIDGLVAAPGAHNDGIQMLGMPRGIAVLRSRIVNPNPQTSAVTIAGDGIRIEHNYLSGGGWTVYAGSSGRQRSAFQRRGVHVIGNVIGRDNFLRGGRFGAITGWVDAGNEWRGNRYSTGEPLRP